MRLFALLLLFSSLCAHEEPILFLTWKKDPQHTMTAVWLSQDPTFNGLIQWKLPDEEQYRQKAAIKTLLNFCKEPHYLFQAEIAFLKPDHIYEFKIEGLEKRYQFRTAPRDLEEHPVKFIVGGDVFHDTVDSLKAMMHTAAQFDPLFCLLGGDLAYAFTSKKSEEEDVGRWFSFLSCYEKEMVTPQGLMIPLIPVLGNHDIKGGFLAGPRNAKFFFSVFPTPGNLGYNTLDFGHWMSLFLLDSGHANPISGSQTKWLKTQLGARSGIPFLFALYHVGAYPSYRAFNSKRAQEIRKQWTPLFDQFNLTAAFENHDHTLKRTKPLKENLLDENGVLYLGDGSFGVSAPRIPRTPHEAWYLAYASPSQAVWGVTLRPNQAEFTAIDVAGNILDRTTKTKR